MSIRSLGELGSSGVLPRRKHVPAATARCRLAQTRQLDVSQSSPPWAARHRPSSSNLRVFPISTSRPRSKSAFFTSMVALSSRPPSLVGLPSPQKRKMPNSQRLPSLRGAGSLNCSFGIWGHWVSKLKTPPQTRVPLQALFGFTVSGPFGASRVPADDFVRDLPSRRPSGGSCHSARHGP